VTVRGRGPRAQLADVARMAGVSVSTASKILNGVANVSARAETRQRVLDAAAALGYRPHVAARALAGASAHAIALLVPELTNPVYSTIIRGAFAQARVRGYTVMVAEDFDEQEADESFGNLVAAGHVDGILMASARPGHPVVEGLVRQGIPHVFVNRAVEGSGRNVTMDQAAASALVVDHLAGLGHETIGHASGPRGLETGHTRAVTFAAAAAERGVRRAPISHTSFDERGGALAVAELLEREPALTAIYAGALSQAVGVVHALHRRGARIPEDVSVIAYDDLPLAEFLVPPLDTVAMPLLELGGTAVDALVDQIGGAPPRDLVIPTAPHLVLRGSSAEPVAVRDRPPGRSRPPAGDLDTEPAPS
jgi:DNA-binding LacI/PurR family transcriptional regulator